MKRLLALVNVCFCALSFAENFAGFIVPPGHSPIVVPPVIASFDPSYATQQYLTPQDRLRQSQDQERSQLIKQQREEYLALIQRQQASGGVIASFDPFATSISAQPNPSALQEERQRLREMHRQQRQSLAEKHRWERESLQRLLAGQGAQGSDPTAINYTQIMNFCAQQPDPDAQAACLFTLTNPY